MLYVACTCHVQREHPTERGMFDNKEVVIGAHARVPMQVARVSALVKRANIHPWSG
jgi:hypothetical protein